MASASVTAAWTSELPALRLVGHDTSSPTLLLPPQAREAFDLVASHGIALSESALGQPTLGVKCGCNDAFIVRVEDASDGFATVVTSDGSRINIEQAMLRPLLRGEGLRRWRVVANDEAILWTHDLRDAPLSSLPPW